MHTKHNFPNKMTIESNVLPEPLHSPKDSSDDESSNLFEWLKKEIDDSNLSRKEQEEIGDNLSENNLDINEIIELGNHLKNYKHDTTTNTVKLHIVPASKRAMSLNRKPERPRTNTKV